MKENSSHHRRIQRRWWSSKPEDGGRCCRSELHSNQPTKKVKRCKRSKTVLDVSNPRMFVRTFETSKAEIGPAVESNTTDSKSLQPNQYLRQTRRLDNLKLALKVLSGGEENYLSDHKRQK
jgi:hypothetical protein